MPLPRQFRTQKETCEDRLAPGFCVFNSYIEFQKFMSVNRYVAIASVKVYKAGSASDLDQAYFQVEVARGIQKLLE